MLSRNKHQIYKITMTLIGIITFPFLKFDKKKYTHTAFDTKSNWIRQIKTVHPIKALAIIGYSVERKCFFVSCPRINFFFSKVEYVCLFCAICTWWIIDKVCDRTNWWCIAILVFSKQSGWICLTFRSDRQNFKQMCMCGNSKATKNHILHSFPFTCFVGLKSPFFIHTQTAFTRRQE